MCGCEKNKEDGMFRKASKVASNLIEAVKTQPDKLKWFREGGVGILKCLGMGATVYTDEEISQHRDICRKCEFSTKNENGELTGTSQCMAPDPDKDGGKCGCLILCKTQVDKKGCPLKYWPLTVSVNNNQ